MTSQTDKQALQGPDMALADAAADMIRTTGQYWRNYRGPATDDVFANELGPYTILYVLPPFPFETE